MLKAIICKNNAYLFTFINYKKKISFRKLYIYELTIKHVNYQC